MRFMPKNLRLGMLALLLAGVVIPLSFAADNSPSSQPADDPIVHITSSGKKYHAAGCRYLKKSDIEIKLSEAKKRHLSPCSVCNPPG